MALSFIDSKGNAREMSKEEFRQKFYYDRKKEDTMTKVELKKKIVIPPVVTKSEKNGEKREIAKILKESFEQLEIPFVSTGKTGEYAIRMNKADYTIKVTAKKERLDEIF